MAKKKTNDQGDIIEALHKKDYTYVWERVKYVGYKDVPDIHERFIFFYKAALDFDPSVNNNFIHFYKRYLRFLRFDRNKTFRVTANRAVIKKLKEQAISPTKETTKLVEELKQWNN